LLEPYCLLDFVELALAEIIFMIAVRMTLYVVSLPYSRYIRVVYTFANTAKGLSCRPREHSQRGLSGKNHILTICTKGMRACKDVGTIHETSVVYLIMPNTVQAAIIELTYHNVLYMVVSFPRCWG
jgi:hypothetical protein